MPLGRKQTIRDQADWQAAIAASRDEVPDARLDQLVDEAATRIRDAHRVGTRLGYSWSGGKDSQALRFVIEASGVPHTAILSVPRPDLGWPAMRAWHKRHAPETLHTYIAPLDLTWLAKNPRMLFPATEQDNSRWMRLMQHTGQRVHFRQQNLGAILIGRRRIDGNWVGRNGEDHYTDRHGTTRWSPLADWSHEAVFALLQRHEMPLPPCYDWPNGWWHGTGEAWPSRQFTGSVEQGFADCWEIDPQVVRAAADVLPQARDWMLQTGRA
jgi:3'-phosphoadenosine 5'-phosphosulfate sulfotransferase (PAPS reductase)/FAD synthetase